MTKDTETLRSNAKATWHKPDVQRIEASDAENAGGAIFDGAAGQS